jgi:hypothetical protein
MTFINYQNLSKFSTTKNIIISAVIFILFIILFLTKFTPVEKKVCQGLPENAVILDLEPGYSADRAYEILENLNESGRKTYFRNLLTIDMAFPVIYGFFFSILIASLLRKIINKNSIAVYLILLPFAASISDIMENIIISIMISGYPARLIQLAKIASFITGIKFVITAGCILLIIVLLIILIVKATMKKFRE